MRCNVASRADRAQPRLTARMPHKKPRGGELAKAQRQENRALGAGRIRVEHHIGWLKHWAILATRFRCAHDRYTPILCVICGLVDAQTARWQTSRDALFGIDSISVRAGARRTRHRTTSRRPSPISRPCARTWGYPARIVAGHSYASSAARSG